LHAALSMLLNNNATKPHSHVLLRRRMRVR
jgi:hypothetical protein